MLQTFDEWFYSAPHRQKYAKDSPAYLAAKEAWEEVKGFPLTTSYVQVVPDKCDRIVWRNRYFHLPIETAPKFFI